MALTEQVQLDIQNAQRQITALEQQLAGLGSPINVPVDIDADVDPLRQIEDSLRRLAGIPVDVDIDTADLSQAQRDILDMARSLDDATDEADQFEREIRQAGNEAERTGRRGQQAFGNLGTSLKGLAVAAAGFIGLREIGQFFNESIQAASALEESTSKAQVVFGSFFDDIQAFAGTAPQALGLANSAALEFTGTFGNLFTALGLSQQAAAELSPEIVQLGADLASFNNIDVGDALEKLRSGLVGEAEPLRALGVNLTAATVEAKALELGLAGVGGEISEAAKVQARYALILEQTTNAQGDFARTSEGIANTQRTLAGEFENLQASIGQALLPAFAGLLEAGQGLIPLFEDLAPAIGFVGEVVAGTLQSFQPLADLFGLLIDPITDLIDAASAGADTEGLDRVAASARELFENTDEALPLLKEFQVLLDTGFDSASLRAAFVGLADDIEAGVEPLNAAKVAIREFAEEGTLTEDLLLGVIETAQLTSGEIANIRRSAREGDFGFLTPNELRAVNDGLESFIDVGGRFEGRITAAGRALQLFGRDVNIVDLTDVFDTSGLDAEIADLESQFSRLPTAFDGVREAFKNDENEIVDDFSTFATNLEAELAAQLAFFENINLLRAMGFDDLADKFLDLGIESAGLLADGLQDPAALGRAEDAIDAYEATIDRGLRQGTVDSVAAAVNSISDLETALASLEDVSIRASVFLSLTGPGAEFAGSFGTGSSRTSELQGGQVSGGSVTVNQTFTSPTTPTTEATRSAQQINSLVASSGAE